MSRELPPTYISPNLETHRRIVPKFQTTRTFSRRFAKSENDMVRAMDRALAARRRQERRAAQKSSPPPQ